MFVTSKVWNTERGYEKTIAAFEKTLSDLGLDYLDLYLIHWPASSSQYDNWEEINLETWRAMTELYKAGRIKSIGVSNFLPHHLKALMKTEVPPMVNQIEYHPGLTQAETVEYVAIVDFFTKTVTRNFSRNLKRANANAEKHCADESVDYFLETLSHDNRYPSDHFVLYVDELSCVVHSETLYKALAPWRRSNGRS